MPAGPPTRAADFRSSFPASHPHEPSTPGTPSGPFYRSRIYWPRCVRTLRNGALGIRIQPANG
jgi:hypothetical protein